MVGVKLTASVEKQQWLPKKAGLDVNDKSESRALLPTRPSSGWPNVPPDRFDGGLGSAVRCCGSGGPRATSGGQCQLLGASSSLKIRQKKKKKNRKIEHCLDMPSTW